MFKTSNYGNPAGLDPNAPAQPIDQHEPFIRDGGPNDDTTSSNRDNPKDGEHRRSSQAVLCKGLPLYTLVIELFGIALSICFLVLGACIASLEGKPESRWSSQVVQATKIAPSVWPIVFSGIVGSALRALADWRVERGVPLLTLEQLLGSLTMAGTIISTFKWSVFRVSSLLLIILWAFNPLGSQASFRGVHLEPSNSTSPGTITYYNSSLGAQMWLSPYTANFQFSTKPIKRALFSSSLVDFVSSTQYVDPTRGDARDVITMLGGEKSVAVQAAMDVWGNPRVPSLEDQPGFDPNDPNKWIETPWREKMTNYTSLIGDRLDGINRSFIGNTSFQSSSSYQKFACMPWLHLNNTSPSSNRSMNDSGADAWLTRYTGKNYNQHAYPQSSNYEWDYRKFFVALVLQNMTTTANKSEMLFASHDLKNGTSLYVTRCTSKTTYLDTAVTCLSKGTQGRTTCGIDAIRQMPVPPTDPDFTILDPAAFWYQDKFLLDFTDAFRNLEDSSDSSSNQEYYMMDPLSAFANSTVRDTLVDISKLDIKLFDQRFSLLWNTFWKATWAGSIVMGGNYTQLLTGRPSGGPPYPVTVNTTSQVTIPLPPVYVIDRVWLVLYFMSVGVMFAAAVAALVIRALCHAPVLLGYVSSLTRNSAYFPDVDNNVSSAEDGPTRSKRLGGLRVMVADVRDRKDAVGRIAFAPKEIGGKVGKGRWYD